MYTNNNFERLFIRYKAEGLPNNESILRFCDRYGVPHNLFDKWFQGYHTVISTCRAQGFSALRYLKTFFREISLGRTDYENLMPMTIGISVNNQ